MGNVTYKNYINGAWVESKSGRTVPNLNPANTDEVLGYAPSSTKEEATTAIRAAQDAFPAWRATPAPVRGRIIYKAMELMIQRKEELANMLTQEEGKLLSEARGEVQRSINILEYIAGEGRRMQGETVPSELPNTFCYTVREPLGVVALITPWNFPVAIPVWKIAPALVSGNTAVFKPASLTPGTAQMVVKIFADAGLPRGVLNLVMGSGGTVGDELVNNPLVRAVSFTGSNDIGSKLYDQVAARGCRAQCEMGGKNAVVVMEDCDFNLALEGTVQGAFGSTGQRCTATSRAVVMEEIADRFVDALVKRAQAMRLGGGLDAGVHMGPLVDESQLNTVLKYIDIGRQEGAKLRTGGARLTDGALAKGYFVSPTVFDHTKPEMRIAQEEIFGPVLPVIRVKSFDQAIAAANSVKYGLAASIYTSDISKAMKFADHIQVGIVHINQPTVGGEAQLPFGGSKATGVGPREQGSVAIDFYSEIKVVYLDYTGKRREGNLY